MDKKENELTYGRPKFGVTETPINDGGIPVEIFHFSFTGYIVGIGMLGLGLFLLLSMAKTLFVSIEYLWIPIIFTICLFILIFFHKKIRANMILIAFSVIFILQLFLFLNSFTGYFEVNLIFLISDIILPIMQILETFLGILIVIFAISFFESQLRFFKNYLLINNRKVFYAEINEKAYETFKHGLFAYGLILKTESEEYTILLQMWQHPKKIISLLNFYTPNIESKGKSVYLH